MADTQANNDDWDELVQVVVDILKEHQVTLRDDVLFDLQAKEKLAADIIEKLDDVWHKKGDK